MRYYDTQVPGLIVAVTPSDAKIFYLYKKINGRPVEYRIGRYPEVTIELARKSAATAALKYAAGGDPQKERIAKRNISTLKALFDYWLEHAKQRKRTWQDDLRMFDKYLAGWHNRKLDSIKPANVAHWHDRIGRDHGKITANRCKALLSTLYTQAPKLGYEGPNPCKGVDNFPEQSRERYLVPDEMKAFFAAVLAEDQPWRDFFLLAILTGQRRGNVASMQWVEIDLGNALWTIAAAKSKAKKPITVALSPPALVIVRRRREEIKDDCPWVFPGSGKEGRLIDPKKAWARILTRSGIVNLRMHDLRRSLGNWQAALGASLSVIRKSLGHNDLKSSQVYARLQLDPVRDSVTKAGRAMLEAGGVNILTVESEVVDAKKES